MSKILTVFGATGRFHLPGFPSSLADHRIGQQGGSVVSHVLTDSKLSKHYKIRAVTRDASSRASKDLEQRGAEVIQADLNDAPSLDACFKDAHTIFLVGAPSFGPGLKQREYDQGKLAVDKAVAAGIKYIIYSSLPHVEKISGGKYTKVGSFDGKAELEDYIRGLKPRVASAFVLPGSFMANYNTVMKPVPAGNGSYIMARHVSPSTMLPLIDTAGDTGKYVGAILAEPDQYEGKQFCAASGLYSLAQIAEIISKKTGKTVTYSQVSEEEFKGHLPDFLPKDTLVQMMSYQQDFGYYGKETTELVEWARTNARGKVRSFEDYLDANPLSLE